MQDLARKFADDPHTLPCTIEIHTPDGRRTLLGSGTPALTVRIHNAPGERAVRGLSLLGICEAYIRGDIDLDGDLIAAAAMQTRLSDREIFIKLWRRVKPWIFGRERCNQEWIGDAYDRHNLQLISADQDFHTYTPGLYASEHDTLEAGAVRKLQAAFDQLNLAPGDHALDVGCGWGGFIRFCTARQVRMTGITLSRHQLAFVQRIIERDRLDASASYQDFFTFRPPQPYDAISLMGVMEDLSDYGTVIDRLAGWVRPGGRVYMDFAASKERVATSSFITKYIWPGLFRMVYLPELIDAVSKSPFELVLLDNDRVNYYLWAKESYRRWIERKAVVLQQSDERMWRTFHLMHAGCASIMRDATRGASAFRMVLEMPEPAAQARARADARQMRLAAVQV